MKRLLVCKALLCDFVSGYLSAIVQHESFRRLEQPLLYRVLSTGLAVVPTDRLMEAVHKWADARLQREDEGDERQQQQQQECRKDDEEDEEEECKVGKTRRSREDRRSELLASLLPPATLVRAFAQAWSDPFQEVVILTALGAPGCAVQPLGAGEHRLRRRRPAGAPLPGLALYKDLEVSQMH